VPNKTIDFAAWMGTIHARMETTLQRFLPAPEIVPERLHRAMRYAVLGGGKRVRPLLAFAAGELAEADPARLEVVAAAVEMIHAYSLAHDDLPCMDNDVLRRGKPTCHVEFDEATALLAGDALQPLAFQILTEHVVADSPGAQIEMLKILATASGSRGMSGGQAIDLASVGKTLTLPELEFMHIHKTGALIRAAAVLGARCGRALDTNAFDRLEHYAKTVGLAFQVVDETAGKDAAQEKPTYVSILGLADARALAEELRAEAHAALASFGARAVRLRELADFIVLRRF
jgi:farnesyl diphosphate synthase